MQHLRHCSVVSVIGNLAHELSKHPQVFYVSETNHDSTYNHAHVSIVEGISLSPTDTALNMSKWMNLWTAQDSDQNYHKNPTESFQCITALCESNMIILRQLHKCIQWNLQLGFLMWVIFSFNQYIFVCYKSEKKICSDNIRVPQKCHNCTQNWDVISHDR